MDMAVEIRYSGETVTVQQGARDIVNTIQPDWGAINIQSVVMIGGYPYEGSYTAQPSWEDQVFPTKTYKMLDDFTVNKILKLEVGNEAGGMTLSI